MYLGIDPGLSGALAILDEGGRVVLLEDMPTAAHGAGKAKVNRHINPAALHKLMTPHAGGIVMAMVERVSAMPGQGVSGVFSFGDSFGAIRAVLACAGIPVSLVSPASWKRSYRLPPDKERARARAIELWPTVDLHRKKDHGRAEALLIAEFCRRRSR